MISYCTDLKLSIVVYREDDVSLTSVQPLLCQLSKQMYIMSDQISDNMDTLKCIKIPTSTLHVQPE